MLLAASVTVSFWGAGCMVGMGYSARDKVTEAAREYNDGVRWGKYEQAAKHVASERRQQFVDRHKALDEELEIADYEMVSMGEIDKSDRKKYKSVANMDYTWTLRSQGLVKKTSTKQFWEEQDGGWVMTREERVKGAPLTLFEEPKASTDEKRAEKTPEKPSTTP
jgi:hypothetical protein